jgi:hypothetical protein
MNPRPPTPCGDASVQGLPRLEVMLNGAPCAVPEGASLADLLSRSGIAPIGGHGRQRRLRAPWRARPPPAGRRPAGLMTFQPIVGG